MRRDVASSAAADRSYLEGELSSMRREGETRASSAAAAAASAAADLEQGMASLRQGLYCSLLTT